MNVFNENDLEIVSEDTEIDTEIDTGDWYRLIRLTETNTDIDTDVEMEIAT
jgi:hypothetical protein